MNPNRRIVYDFLHFSYITRMEIVMRLGLTEEEDRNIQENDRYALYFKRAQERGLLEQLRAAIDQEHAKDD